MSAVHDAVSDNARIAADLGLSVAPTADPAIGFAYRLAEEAHRGQVRKYTGQPYIAHPIAVAVLVHHVYPALTPVLIALLHDVIEDTHYTRETLAERMRDPATAALVDQISDVSRPEDGNRAERKRLDREHLADAHPSVKLVKLADLIDNTRSIVEHDPAFARVYLAEKRLLLQEVLHPLTVDPLAVSYSFRRAYDTLFTRAAALAGYGG